MSAVGHRHHLGEPSLSERDRTPAALERARTWKERRYLELAGDHGRARLVVLAGEIGLASDTVRSTFLILKGRIHAALMLVGVQCLVAPQLAPTPCPFSQGPCRGCGPSPSANKVLGDWHAGQLLVTVCCCELWQVVPLPDSHQEVEHLQVTQLQQELGKIGDAPCAKRQAVVPQAREFDYGRISCPCAIQISSSGCKTVKPIFKTQAVWGMRPKSRGCAT